MSLSVSPAGVPDPWLKIDALAKNGDEHLISCDFGDGSPAVFLAFYKPHHNGFSWRYGIDGSHGIREQYVNGYLPVPNARGVRYGH